MNIKFMMMTKGKIILYLLTLVNGVMLCAIFLSRTSVPDRKHDKVNFSPKANCAPHETAYSCAMHPKVVQQTPGDCPLCGMAMTRSDNTTGNPNLLAMTWEAVQMANIQTERIGMSGAPVKELRLKGKVVPDESRVYKQVIHLPGRIEKLYVNKTGQEIRKGQRIASIYSRELIGMIEALEFSKTSQSVVRSAENNLAAWKISDRQIRSFDVKSGHYHHPVDIYADVSGTVIRKLAVEGDVAANSHMGQPTALFDVADLSRLWVIFDAYESDLKWLKRGQQIDFTADAYPDEVFSGRISYIDKLIDPVTRTAGIRVEIDNPDEKLKPEMLARGMLRIDEQTPTHELSVPKSAVLWTGKRSVVYVKNPSFTEVPVYEFREVNLGEPLRDRYIVKEGLSAGEEVVVNGAFQVDAAAQLSNKRSMMQPVLKSGEKQPFVNFVEQ